MPLFKHRPRPWMLLLVLAAISTLSAAEALNPRAIVDRANLAAFYAGADGRSEARMTITDSQGRVQRRQFTLLRRDIEDGGDQDMMIFFSRPADVRDTVYRVAKHLDRDDDRWLYLPGLDLVRRVSAGDKRTSFVGSHFFYEDVSGRNPDLDHFELLEQDQQRWLIEATPKDPSSVEFSRYRISIDKQSALPMQIDFYDRSAELYRRLEVLNSTLIEGHPTAVVSRMSDLTNGAQTLLEFRFIDYDLNLPASVFSERSLRTPPRQYLARPSR